MPSALPLRTDYSATDLRVLAKRTKDNNQSRRLLSLAAVLDGMSRTDAARIGGMDRQTRHARCPSPPDRGPRGMAYNQCARHPQKYHADPAKLLFTGTEPGRKHLAVHACQQALK